MEMKPIVLIACLILSIHICLAQAQDNSSKTAKSAFGQPFDEIVVESDLTVRRKDPLRQARNKPAARIDASARLAALEPGTNDNTKRTKRQPLYHSSNSVLVTKLTQ